MTFIDDVLSGKASLDDVDHYRDLWDASDDSTGSYHSFLGLLWPEYAMWVEDYDVLAYVINARREQIELRQLLHSRAEYDPLAVSLLTLSERYSKEWDVVAAD